MGTIASILFAPNARPFTLNGSQLIEDFSTDDFADYAGMAGLSNPGLWNLVDGCAQAGVVANADPNKPITFGDGSDGSLDSANGATFNTDSHPKGFNYRSVNITGGVITVTGSHPLVIRSLTTATITPVLSASGTNGTNGAAHPQATGGSGGVAVSCPASNSQGGFGGQGGNASGAAGSNGGAGLSSSGTPDAATPGPGQTGANSNAIEAAAPTTGPAVNFDVAANFICGGGGGGGGGYSQGAGGTFAVGGGGGGGGGLIHVSAVGALTVDHAHADGGGGGNGAGDGSGNCSGDGSGGSGGAVWLQTFRAAISTAANPTVNGGAGGNGTVACFGAGASSTGSLGIKRGDAGGGAPPWADTGFSTTNAAPNQTSIVLSKAYDLGTLNASFSSASPKIVGNGGTGTVKVEFAGSTDGATFSAFTSDITTLSDQSFRYLKFRVTIQTGAAAPPQQLKQITVGYSDAGLAKLDLKISPGCGTISGRSGRDGGSHGHAPPLAVAQYLGGWLMFLLFAHRLLRLSGRRPHRPA